MALFGLGAFGVAKEGLVELAKLFVQGVLTRNMYECREWGNLTSLVQLPISFDIFYTKYDSKVKSKSFFCYQERRCSNNYGLLAFSQARSEASIGG